MFFRKTPLLVQKLFPHAYWNFKNSPNLYLTFDDGPHPDSTPFLLDVLATNNIKATFFCLGKNIKSYPHLFQSIIDRGHAVGYHGFNHISGWTTDYEVYMKNATNLLFDSNLFRPPYGRLTWSQYKSLHSSQKIIMWDIMPGDFSPSISANTCILNIKKHSKSGSIITLHDSPDTLKKLKIIIPSVNDFFNKNKLTYGKINL